MLKNYESVARFIKNNKIEEVELKYSDLEGRWHHLSIPAKRISKKTFDQGEGIDTSSLKGFGNVENSDAVIIPDLRTSFVDTVKGNKILAFICDVFECKKKKPHVLCPRAVAKKATKYLKNSGLADNLQTKPELEFHIFDKVTLDLSINTSYFKTTSAETLSSDNNSMTGIDKGNGYHIEEPFDRFYELRSEISANLENAGVPVNYHHHESGGPSQQEIEILSNPFLATADSILKAKYIIRNTCFGREKVAIFLPKPLNFTSGNGMHVHLYLEKNKKSLFFDRGGTENLSMIAMHFIGGIMKHGRAITGFACGSTNSFRRLIPGYEAPIYFGYSLANRSAAIRIPGYENSSSDTRIEFRISDATANPYLLISSLLLAGMDGIKNKTHPGKPSNTNLYSKKIKNLEKIPETLEEALQSLDKDRGFLKHGQVFNDTLIDQWLQVKREEIRQVEETVNPTEYKLYFNL